MFGYCFEEWEQSTRPKSLFHALKHERKVLATNCSKLLQVRGETDSHNYSLFMIIHFLKFIWSFKKVFGENLAVLIRKLSGFLFTSVDGAVFQTLILSFN
jgi:hypothetical protein